MFKTINIKAVVKLPLKYKLLALKMYSSYFRVNLMVKLCPRKKLVGRIRKKLVTVQRMQNNLQQQHITLMLNKVKKYIPLKTSCLTNAIVTACYMSKYRHAGTLHLGIQKAKPNNLKAHAWVEQLHSKAESKQATGNYKSIYQIPF